MVRERFEDDPALRGDPTVGRRKSSGCTQGDACKARLEALELRFHSLARLTGDGLVLHAGGRIRLVNPALERMVGQSAGALLGGELLALFAAEERGAVLRRLRDPDGPPLACTCHGPKDEPREVELVAARLDSGAVPAAMPGEEAGILLLRDPGGERASPERLRRLSELDPLTGLLGRARLLAELDRLAARAATAADHGAAGAVLLIDLAHFKELNDRHGHRTGDALLVAVAGRLRRALRRGDLLARLGGDEFVAVLAGTPQPSLARRLAARLLDLMLRPFVVDGVALQVGARIGVALFPADGKAAETLLAHADLALSAAKSAGGAGVSFFDAEFERRARHRRSLEDDLRLAIARGALELHYQPQVRLATGRITGVEALLRWNHPRLGRIAPGEFIPLAESTGLIRPLGAWVLRAAVRQAAQWRAGGVAGVTMAVNVSAAQLEGGELATLVGALLDEHGLPAEALELELTESVFLDREAAEIGREIARLRAQGVALALDDFGTGYSCLAHLGRLPLGRLKIDRSFVQGLGRREDAALIVKAIIGLARSLELRVLAEGVETEVQRALLGAHGCEFAQGHLFGRPMPAAAILPLLLPQGARRQPVPTALHSA